ATPLVADLKERDPQMKALKKRVLAKRAAAAAKGESPDDYGPEDLRDDAETAGTAIGRPRSHGRTPGKR
ncbi:protein translocase subunit SecF, partial [Streptomyces sp. SID7499]|nr:protein translocase subunit SecF [Streptomyces sp. SID7499]